eukprot:Awhi_evm1s2306
MSILVKDVYLEIKPTLFQRRTPINLRSSMMKNNLRSTCTKKQLYILGDDNLN